MGQESTGLTERTLRLDSYDLLELVRLPLSQFNNLDSGSLGLTTLTFLVSESGDSIHRSHV
jgi:hypothetical protein